MAWTRSSTERVETPLDVGLLDHRCQRLLGHPPRLQEAGEVTPLPQLRDLQRDRAGAGLPGPITVAVAACEPLRRPLAVPGAGEALHLQCHQALGREADHLAQKVGVGSLFKQLLKGHRVVGHRRRSSSSLRFARLVSETSTLTKRRPTMAAFQAAGGRGPLELSMAPTSTPAENLLHHLAGHQRSEELRWPQKIGQVVKVYSTV